MAYTIAVAGKGGTGKTTVLALVVRYLRGSRAGLILAVDADANANLHQALGMKMAESVADIIDEVKTRQLDGIPGGMTKEQYIEYRLQDCLQEGRGVDLLIMGRPEGPGCYCYANNVLRGQIDRLSKLYAYVVMDNEAGMEHLSRRTTREVDLLLIVTDVSLAGVRAALRILQVSKDLGIIVGRSGLILNRVQKEVSPAIKKAIEDERLPLLGMVPYDEDIPRFELEERSLLELPDESPAVRAIGEIIAGVGESQ